MPPLAGKRLKKGGNGPLDQIFLLHGGHSRFHFNPGHPVPEYFLTLWVTRDKQERTFFIEANVGPIRIIYETARL